MRYSFIIPYFKRAKEFRMTMHSYRHFYGRRNDVEYIVVEDGANAADDKAHQELINTLYAFGDLNWTHLMSEHKNQFNPVKHRNEAAKVATGNVLVLTNPECMHAYNILGAMDEEFVLETKGVGFLPEKFGPDHPQWHVKSFRNKYEQALKQGRFKNYVICACENCDMKEADTFLALMATKKHKQWYQHSEKNNRRLHWCSFIAKDNYEKVGGFDEHYANFCGYDDDDFREIILHSNIPVVTRDDLVVIHVNHSRAHHGNTMPMSKAGLVYYKSKWPETKMEMFK